MDAGHHQLTWRRLSILRYAEHFLKDPEAAKNLLTETGYSTNQALEVVTRIGELCVLSEILNQFVVDHVPGDNLPHRFEVEISITPLQLHRTQEVDLAKSLEDCNVLIPLREGQYRAMLSSTLNRLFSLTAEDSPESIRGGFSGFSNTALFESSLDEIEWDIVRVVHEAIDRKYLHIEDLELGMVPHDLVTKFSASREIADMIESDGGIIDGAPDEIADSILNSETLKPDILVTYHNSILQMADAVEKEVERQRNLIRSFNIYPRSFVGRRSPPLAGSSWNHRPDFKSHPLIRKFLEVIKENHEHLAMLADKYEDYITEVAEGVKLLPRGIGAVSLFVDIDGMHEASNLQTTWTSIEQKTAGLSVQAKMVENLISSMDTLFAQKE